MAYDPSLAERVRSLLEDKPTRELKMFGGLAFMVHGHMCCGIMADRLMARIGPDAYPEALAEPFVSEMDFAKRPMKGMVFVAAEGLQKKDQLQAWVSRCLFFVESLPPK